MVMFLADPFEMLLELQRSLDAFRDSDWLESSLSGTGAYPPLNIFRKGDDFVVVAEVPGIKKSDIQIQVKDNTVRVAGKKDVKFPEKASLHRRERLAGDFDRAITVPIKVDAGNVKAECRDGILAIFLPRAAQDKPKSIQIA
jgi:HSP20 family protein